jgi:hypothetical protein
MTDNRRLELVHDLTANYSDRQGLRVVPIGLAVLAQALPMSWRFLDIDAHLLCLIAGLIGYGLIGRLYARRFGAVDELPYPGPPVALQAILVLVLFVIAMSVDIIARPPLFTSGLLIAFWITVVAWPARSVRAQYLAVGILLGLISLLPLAGISHDTAALAYGIAFGAALVVAGIADHVLFTRLMSEPAHD